MRKKFLPFTLPDITKKEISAVSKVLKSGWLTTGLVTQKFEKNFAKFIYIFCSFLTFISVFFYVPT